MPHAAYRSDHQRIRAVLITELRARPGQPCGLCQLPMFVSQKLELHHSDPSAKRRGEPGDVLTHADCNQLDGHRRGAEAANASKAARAAAAAPCQHRAPPASYCPLPAGHGKVVEADGHYSTPCDRLHVTLCKRCGQPEWWGRTW